MKHFLFFVCFLTFLSAANADLLLKPGDPAPSRLLYNFNDAVNPNFNPSRGIALKSFFGTKAVVLSFFTKECKACMVEIPALQQIKDEYADKNIVFYAVLIKAAGETLTELEAEIKKRGYTIDILYHSAIDAIMKDYIKDKSGKLLPVPLMYVIGKSGNISSIHCGFDTKNVEAEKNRIKAEINKALQK
ncbi:MAG: hypothetical protein A2096_14965 [Spirochaetes bacterium GWF1_41_5]|nr:MAG: hypothetical protein A2096_14965 [Spirochaetes bacterium GWF1_41_5]HBE04213.1 hypothetical protein [Spirochaetia bacterium]